ncbi:MAG: hypothetical protein HY689_05410 [Chloroflexi bacterium]|nr:hypothetical protein [Chloroflexota bacterium]
MTAPTPFELQIHQRLRACDPVAPEDLAEAYLERLIRRLRARLRGPWDDMALYDAATDALMDYIEGPSHYDPTRGSLLAYLTMSAWRDLQNAWAREDRRSGRTLPLDDVAQRGGDRNTLIEEATDPAEVVAREWAAREWEQRLLQAFPDPLDRQLLQLIFEGERRTAAYSAVLGLERLDVAQQRRIVKRHKDRIKKRLQRWGEQFRE